MEITVINVMHKFRKIEVFKGYGMQCLLKEG